MFLCRCCVRIALGVRGVRGESAQILRISSLLTRSRISIEHLLGYAEPTTRSNTGTDVLQFSVAYNRWI